MATWKILHLTTDPYPAQHINQVHFARSTIECASVCLTRGQCGGYDFDTECRLYYWLTRADVHGGVGSEDTAIRVFAARLDQVQQNSKFDTIMCDNYITTYE